MNAYAPTAEKRSTFSREQVIQFLHGAQWKYAKTMPQMPHDYTLRKTWNEKTFIEVVIFIRGNGYKKHFKGRAYLYLDDDQYCYWTMGNSLDRTILINRAKL